MPLCGKFNPDEEYPTLGWVVQWKSPQVSKCGGWTTTAWAAELYLVDNNPKIKAMWHLAQQSTPKKRWANTLDGCGEFSLVSVEPIPGDE